MVSKNKSPKLGAWHLGKQSCSLEDNFAKRGPLYQCKVCWIQLDRYNYWAGRRAQVAVTASTVLEVHQAIADTVMQKKMKARALG